MTGRRRKNLTGRQVGHLTVLGPTEHDARGPRAWLCRCDCGKEVIYSGFQLGRHMPKSCGCIPRGRSPRLVGASSRGERNQAIRAARQRGETLAVIGARFGLTRQRVQQILKTRR